MIFHNNYCAKLLMDERRDGVLTYVRTFGGESFVYP